MVEVGDRVLVESEKVGAVTRSGVVTAVEDRLITVRWDSGSESVFVPSAGSLQVTGHKPPQGMRATPEVAGRGVDPPPQLGRLGGPIPTMDRRPTAVLTRVVAGRPAPSTVELWGQLLLWWPSASGCLSGHEPPGSLVSGDGVDNPDRTATARRQGQRPSISTSSEKLRNVLIATISPKTATFSSEGWTATVLMMSAATKNSRPSRMLRPNTVRTIR
jgi:Domain of unknown function (DUF1918)